MTRASHAVPISRVREVLTISGLTAIFLVTRVLILLSLNLEAVKFVANDVSYYGYHLYRLQHGEPGVMLEYPVPAVWLLQFLYWLGNGWQYWQPVYAAAFVILDALVAVTLYRRCNPWGALFWVLFTGANGAIVWYRFDLIPAALVAWACLLASLWPRVAGGLIGLGAAIKLWPAMLIGPLFAPGWRSPKARARLIGFAVVGFALAAASLITSGWNRSASPIAWQRERGLQIESVPATVLMYLRTFTDNPSWHVFLSEYNALELQGPDVEFWLKVSTFLTTVSVLLAAYLTFRLVTRFATDDERLHEAMLLAVLTVVLATIVANKTLSPQYIPWLGGPVAALLTTHTSRWLRPHLSVLSVALVLIAGLTQYTYPWGTYGIMANPIGSGPETSVLILRNVLLVTMLGYGLALTLRASRSTPEPISAGSVSASS